MSHVFRISMHKMKAQKLKWHRDSEVSNWNARKQITSIFFPFFYCFIPVAVFFLQFLAIKFSACYRFAIVINIDNFLNFIASNYANRLFANNNGYSKDSVCLCSLYLHNNIEQSSVFGVHSVGICNIQNIYQRLDNELSSNNCCIEMHFSPKFINFFVVAAAAIGLVCRV